MKFQAQRIAANAGSWCDDHQAGIFVPVKGPVRENPEEAFADLKTFPEQCFDDSRDLVVVLKR